jgi:hypothetical protein
MGTAAQHTRELCCGVNLLSAAALRAEAGLVLLDPSHLAVSPLRRAGLSAGTSGSPAELLNPHPPGGGHTTPAALLRIHTGGLVPPVINAPLVVGSLGQRFVRWTANCPSGVARSGHQPELAALRRGRRRTPEFFSRCPRRPSPAAIRPPEGKSRTSLARCDIERPRTQTPSNRRPYAQ